ncbi:MAG: conjugal transfer protein TraD [Alphaproteobacteria bacterium]|nr:conjugal transfer protein TraD [Alphaproteobacteria bacterium]
MKQQSNDGRKNRTRLLIQCGGLLSKSGLLEAFHITSADDLQVYENRPKALQLLGFLITCFEENEFNEDNFERWRSVGEKRF